ncbi:MAG: hypothetical protein ACFFAU_06770 [Candidatus Hodarchaeota archaeon]
MDEYNNHQEKEKETQIEQREVEKSSLSIDFWSSRGNMGEKINILIGLNLITLELISTLFQTLKEKEVISTDIVQELTFFQNFLAQIIADPESRLELFEKLKMIESKIASPPIDNVNDFPSPETEVISSSQPIVQSDIGGVFRRYPNYRDTLGVIESIKALINSYSNLSHLGFPNYYLAACEEIYRYQILDDSTLPDHQAIIKVPTQKLKNIISKLLREAPSARLLQNLKRMFPAEHDITPSSTEQEQIRAIIEKYFLNVSMYSDEDQSLSNSLSISRNILKEYNLGSGDLESRIPNVSFSIVKEIHEELDQLSRDNFKRFILSETIILIHRLNDSILQNERFVFFLRRLK